MFEERKSEIFEIKRFIPGFFLINNSRLFFTRLHVLQSLFINRVKFIFFCSKVKNVELEGCRIADRNLIYLRNFLNSSSF
jgi:hypothetical protein